MLRQHESSQGVLLDDMTAQSGPEAEPGQVEELEHWVRRALVEALLIAVIHPVLVWIVI